MWPPFNVLDRSPIKIYSIIKENVKSLLSGDNILYLLLTAPLKGNIEQLQDI